MNHIENILWLVHEEWFPPQFRWKIHPYITSKPWTPFQYCIWHNNMLYPYNDPPPWWQDKEELRRGYFSPCQNSENEYGDILWVHDIDYEMLRLFLIFTPSMNIDSPTNHPIQIIYPVPFHVYLIIFLYD